ncbi:MAG TPA: hypothetical protein VN677_12575 [Gemmatimonadaceae bacterium]|nr:hypothetical protein [Gemmatimonadaceae bacterium]
MSHARLHIESIAAGGDGVARAGSLVVFVPRTAPGDQVDAEIVTHGRFARGAVRRVVSASPLRTDPPCEHYTRDRCGGCQLQHLRYDAQLTAKQRIVRDALQRIGRRDAGEAGDLAVAPSPSPWRYRRKLTLALRRVHGHWIAGLHPYDEPGRVFPLQDCLITDELVVHAWHEVIAAQAELPRARELRGALRRDGAQMVFVLDGGEHWPRSAEFFARVPSLASLWWRGPSGPPVRLHERQEPEATRLPAASFAQVNVEVAAAVRAHALERVLAHEPRTVVDAYAGRGDTALTLAEAGCRVTAIELDEAAAVWSASRLPEGSRSIPARVEDVIATVLPADVVLLNPPRDGVDARVTGVLDSAAPAPRAIVYTSCDAATLSRDLRRMPAWRIASLRSFDMFPQTAHVETVCELIPEHA